MSEANRNNAIHWFEIPCTDLDRAATFYETVLATELRRATFGYPMAIFPYAEPGIGGAIAQSPQIAAGANGPLLFLNCGGDIEACVARVGPAGGKVLEPAFAIPGGFGYQAIIGDTEGNRIALHTR